MWADCREKDFSSFHFSTSSYHGNSLLSGLFPWKLDVEEDRLREDREGFVRGFTFWLYGLSGEWTWRDTLLLVDDKSLQTTSPRPAKAAKLNWSVCLCHKCGVSAEPLSSFTERSWPTLVRAASIHKDSLESFLRSQSITLEAPGVPRGVYHRTCYQEYTNKRALNRLQSSSVPVSKCSTEKQQFDPASPLLLPESEALALKSSQTAAPFTRSKVPQAASKDVCLFCQQQQKKVRGKRQDLSLCMSFEACEAVYNAACVRDDQRVLLK